MNRSLAALSFASLAALAVTSGCRGDDDGGGDGVNVDAPSDDTRIQDVQSEAMVVDTAVTLRGVVVVAKDEYGQRTGNFYVMEPEGGEYSGVLVFGATTDQLTSIQIGDLVDITGARKDEFSCPSCDPPDDKTVTELAPVSTGSLQVVKVGTAPVPAPHVVDAFTFGRMDKEAREAEYEKWEGVLIRVENVWVVSNVRQIGASGANPDPTFRGFGVTGSYEVDSSLTAIPAPPDSGVTEPFVKAGDCLTSVTGMGDYFFEYKVLPRTTADIVKGGTACPAQTATIVNIQNGTIPAGTVVDLGNVVVSAVSFNRKQLWVADAAQAAPNNGIYVYRGTSMAATELPAGVVAGAHVRVKGTVTENNNDAMGETSTQIVASEVTLLENEPVTPPVPVAGQTIASLTTSATAEPYESVFVEITNVRVTSDGTQMNFGVRNMGANGNDALFVAGDDIFRISNTTYPIGTCFAKIRGIWSYQVFENKWAILPISDSAENLVTGGTCN